VGDFDHLGLSRLKKKAHTPLKKKGKKEEKRERSIRGKKT